MVTFVMPFRQEYTDIMLCVLNASNGSHLMCLIIGDVTFDNLVKVVFTKIFLKLL